MEVILIKSVQFYQAESVESILAVTPLQAMQQGEI